MNNNVLLVLFAGAVALAFSFWKTKWILSQDEGTKKMKIIGKNIAEGAMAFLRAEYRVLGFFVVFVALLLGIANYNSNDSSSLISLSFLVGAIASGLAGFLGMTVATKSNNRTTNAARQNLESALNIAFSGGSVMGMSVVGLGVLGLGSLFLLYSNIYGSDFNDIKTVLNILSGFSETKLLVSPQKVDI